MKSTLAFMSVLSFAHAACAYAEADTQKPVRKDECASFTKVLDWRSLDDSNIVIWGVTRSRPFLIRTTGPLPSLRYATAINFVDSDRDGRLCAHGGDSVSMLDGGPVVNTRIYSISKLDPEALLKLEQQYRTPLRYDSSKKKIPKAPTETSAE